MKIIEQLKSEKHLLTLPMALVFAGIGLGAGLITMIACGNFFLYSFLLLPLHAPPAFLFFALFFLNVGLMFYGAGMARAGGCCRLKSNVFILDLLSAVFLILFYISFIRMAAFVFALFMLLFCAALLVLAFKEAFGVSLILSAMQLLLFLYILFMLLLCAAVILLN